VSRSRLVVASLCALDGALQRACGDGLRERQIAVDEDHREIDPVAALELVIAVDEHAPQAEPEPRRLALEQLACASAETAAGAFVEHHLDHGAQPPTVKPSWRSLVTSSLETASMTSR
jgi:hypothetical protein